MCDYLSSFNVLIGHNCIAFDFAVLRKLYNYSYKGTIVDTLLMSRTQRVNRKNPHGYGGRAPHSVEAWGYRLGKNKYEHEDWTKFSDKMLERCHQDVDIQHEIYRFLLKEGEGKWEKAHKLNSKIFQYLQLQEERGFTIDIKHLDKSIQTLERWIDRINNALLPHLPLIVDVLETKTNGVYTYVKKPFKQSGELRSNTRDYIRNYGGDYSSICGPFSRFNIRPLNLDSTIEIKDFLLNLGWQPEKWNEKNGQRTSANLSKDETFNGVQGSLGSLIVKRIQCRQRRSVLTGWRTRCSLRNDRKLTSKVAGIATTGRLRHSVIVNIPSVTSGAFFAKQMRQCFIPRDGMVMVGVDSKGNQMRQLAARMQDDISNRESVKEFTDAVLFGTKEERTDLHSLNQKRSGASTRTLAKNFFYGSILFGAGDAKTGKILGVQPKDARRIKESYFEEMPALEKVIKILTREWKITAKQQWNQAYHRIEYRDGTIKGLDGRPIVVPYEKDLLCYALQSDEAIHMGVAYVMLHKWAEERGWDEEDWGMLIWMHDEFQMESIPELSVSLGKLGCEAIKWAGEYLGIKCLHDGDYLIGESWYVTH